MTYEISYEFIWELWDDKWEFIWAHMRIMNLIWGYYQLAHVAHVKFCKWRAHSVADGFSYSSNLFASYQENDKVHGVEVWQKVWDVKARESRSSSIGWQDVAWEASAMAVLPRSRLRMRRIWKSARSKQKIMEELKEFLIVLPRPMRWFCQRTLKSLKSLH